MNWFQRYGIPGIYFWGLVTLWVLAFYKCGSVSIKESEDIKNIIHGVVGITAGFFLPVGYLITMVAQTLYLFVPFLGAHARASEAAGVAFGTGKWLVLRPRNKVC